MRRAMQGLGLLVAVIVITGCGSEDLVEITYTPEFTSLVTEDKVAQVEIIREPSGTTYIRGETKAGESPGKFKVYITDVDDALQKLLADNNVAFSIRSRPPATTGLCMASLFPVLMVGLIWLVWMAGIVFVLWLALRLVRAVERIAKNTEKE